MSPLNETFQCGDGEALVTFVYGESSAAEREAITRHLAECDACADELAALGSTRQQLAAWMPPHHSLDFRITQSTADADGLATERPPATVLRPAAWWRQPLPAWAQMAAAVAIFASGIAIGGARSGALPSSGTQPSATTAATVSSSATAAAAVATPAAVTRQELAAVEQRLRSELAQVRTSAPAETTETRAVMQRVNQLIAASEARQMKELDFRTSVLARDWANRRTVDLTNIERRLGSTSVRILNNQQDINSLAQRVGYSPAPSPYVP